MKHLFAVILGFILAVVSLPAWAQPARSTVGGTQVVTEAPMGGAAGAPGVYSVVLRAYCASTTTTATVWNHYSGTGDNAALIHYPIASTSSSLHLVSDQAYDALIPQTIRIFGLDATYAPQTEDLTFNASTATSSADLKDLPASTKHWKRVFGAQSIGADPIGNVYIFTTGTVTGHVPTYKGTIQAILDATNKVSFNGFYTIPANRNAVLNYVFIPTTVTSWKILARDYGKQWRTLVSGATTSRVDFDGMIKLPPQTDIQVQVTTATGAVYCYLGLTEFINQ